VAVAVVEKEGVEVARLFTVSGLLLWGGFTNRNTATADATTNAAIEPR